MKKRYIKFALIAVLVLICAIYIVHILREPKSERELFDKNYMNITPEEGTSSFNCFNVQNYNKQRYFRADKGNLAVQKEGSKNSEVLIKNTSAFLIRDDELAYVLWNEPDRVYIREFNSNSEKSISVEKAYLLFNDNEYAYIYSETNVLYKLDKSWDIVKTIDFNEKGFSGCFERACAVKGKFVFATEALQLYVYDEQKETLHKVKAIENEYSGDGDVAEWNGDIYYLLCFYDDGDLHNSLTRLDSAENGIYKLDTDKGILEKVSDKTGEILLSLNNQLCIARTHLGGLSYQIDSAGLE